MVDVTTSAGRAPNLEGMPARAACQVVQRTEPPPPPMQSSTTTLAFFFTFAPLLLSKHFLCEPKTSCRLFEVANYEEDQFRRSALVHRASCWPFA